jgi:mannitol/fructose-specific phosphotransferase system IIA component (Ntr-type)
MLRRDRAGHEHCPALGPRGLGDEPLSRSFDGLVPDHANPRRRMKLRDFFTTETVALDLEAEGKDDLLKELVGALGLDEKSEAILFKTIKRRENLGSTGIGKGIAIPHCRSLVVNRLRLVYGRKLSGVEFNSIDKSPVHHLFLIVAPPLEVSNQYLPVLGKIAQFAKDPEVPDRLLEIDSPEAFFDLLDDRGV